MIQSGAAGWILGSGRGKIGGMDDGFTQHQRDLLLGKVDPVDNEEWGFIQRHANAVVDEGNLPRRNIYGVDAEKMRRDFEAAGEPRKGAKED